MPQMAPPIPKRRFSPDAVYSTRLYVRGLRRTMYDNLAGKHYLKALVYWALWRHAESKYSAAYRRDVTY